MSRMSDTSADQEMFLATAQALPITITDEAMFLAGLYNLRLAGLVERHYEDHCQNMHPDDRHRFVTGRVTMESVPTPGLAVSTTMYGAGDGETIVWTRVERRTPVEAQGKKMSLSLWRAVRNPFGDASEEEEG